MFRLNLFQLSQHGDMATFHLSLISPVLLSTHKSCFSNSFSLKPRLPCGGQPNSTSRLFLAGNACRWRRVHALPIIYFDLSWFWCIINCSFNFLFSILKTSPDRFYKHRRKCLMFAKKAKSLPFWRREESDGKTYVYCPKILHLVLKKAETRQDYATLFDIFPLKL